MERNPPVQEGGVSFSRKNHLRLSGFPAAIVSSMAFSAMAFVVHSSKEHFPPTQFAFARALSNLLFLTPWVWPHIKIAFSRGSLWLWSRSAFGAASAICGFWIIANSTASDARALSNLDPVMLTLIGYFWSKERLLVRKLSGILIIMGASIGLGLPGVSGASLAVVLVAILASCLATGAYLSLKEAAQRFPPLLIIWCFSLVAASGSLLFIDESWSIPVRHWGWFELAQVGAFGLLGQILLTQSFIDLSPAVASAVRLSGLLWALVLELIFHSHVFSTVNILLYVVMGAGVFLLGMRQGKIKSEFGSEVGAIRKP